MASDDKSSITITFTKDHCEQLIASKIINWRIVHGKWIHYFFIANPSLGFTGRKLELKNLHRMLKKCPHSSPFLVITGLGGVGKTELAKAYAKIYEENYSFIMFVACDNPSETTTKFYKLAAYFNINCKTIAGGKEELIPVKTVIDNVYSFCSRLGKMLVIIDNAEEPEDIINILPERSLDKIKILVTSRRKTWEFGNYRQIKILNLKGFNHEEVKQFLNRKLTFENMDTDKDIRRLSERLQHLPFALKRFTTYLNIKNGEYLRKNETKTNLFTISNYLERFDEQTLPLNNSLYPNISDGPIFDKWMESIKKYKLKYGEVGKNAVDLLEYMSFMIPVNIPYRHLFEVDNIKVNKDAILFLHEYSMIDIEGKYLRINCILREVIRDEIEKRH